MIRFFANFANLLNKIHVKKFNFEKLNVFDHRSQYHFEFVLIRVIEENDHFFVFFDLVVVLSTHSKL